MVAAFQTTFGEIKATFYDKHRVRLNSPKLSHPKKEGVWILDANLEYTPQGWNWKHPKVAIYRCDKSTKYDARMMSAAAATKMLSSILSTWNDFITQNHHLIEGQPNGT